MTLHFSFSFVVYYVSVLFVVVFVHLFHSVRTKEVVRKVTKCREFAMENDARNDTIITIDSNGGYAD